MSLPTGTATMTASLSPTFSLSPTYTHSVSSTYSLSRSLSLSVSPTLSKSATASISLVAHTNYSSSLEPRDFVTGQEVRVKVTATLSDEVAYRFNRSEEMGQVQLMVFVAERLGTPTTYGDNCAAHVASGVKPFYESSATGVAPETDQPVDWVGSVYFTFAAPHSSEAFIGCFLHTMPFAWNAEPMRAWQPLFFNILRPNTYRSPLRSEVVVQAREAFTWYHIPDATSMQYAVVELFGLEDWNFTYAASEHCVPQPYTYHDVTACGKGDSFKIVPKGVSCTSERKYFDSVDYFGSKYVQWDGSWASQAMDGIKEDATAGGVGYFGTKLSNPLLDKWSRPGQYSRDVVGHANFSFVNTAYVYVKLPRFTPKHNEFDVCFSSKEQRLAAHGSNISIHSIPVWRKLYPCPYPSGEVQKCVDRMSFDVTPSFAVREENVGWSLFDMTPETWGTLIFDDSHHGALSTLPAYNRTVGYVYQKGGAQFEGDTEGYWRAGNGDSFRIVPESTTQEAVTTRAQDKAGLGSFPDVGCWDTSLDTAAGDGFGKATGFTDGHGGLANQGAQFPSASTDLRGDPSMLKNETADNSIFLKQTYSTLWIPKRNTKWRVCYRVGCHYSAYELERKGRQRLCSRHAGMRVAVWHGGEQGVRPLTQAQMVAQGLPLPNMPPPLPNVPSNTRMSGPPQYNDTAAQPRKWLHNVTIGASYESIQLALRESVLFPQAFVGPDTTFAKPDLAPLYPPTSLRWYMNDTRVNTYGPLLVETLNASMQLSGFLDSRRWNFQRSYKPKGGMNDSVILSEGSVLRLVRKGAPCVHDGGVGSPISRVVFRTAVNPQTNLSEIAEHVEEDYIEYSERFAPVRENADGGEVECNSDSARRDVRFCSGAHKDNPRTNSIAYYLHLPDEPGDYKVCHRVKGWNWVEVAPADIGTTWEGGADNTNQNAMQRDNWGSRDDLIKSYADAKLSYYVTLATFLHVAGNALDTLSMRQPPAEEVLEGSELAFLFQDTEVQLAVGPRADCPEGCAASSDVFRLVPMGTTCDINPFNHNPHTEDTFLSLYCKADRTNVSIDLSGLHNEPCRTAVLQQTLRQHVRHSLPMLHRIAAPKLFFDDIVPFDALATSLAGTASVLRAPPYKADPTRNRYTMCYKKVGTWNWAVFNSSVEVLPYTQPIRLFAPLMKGELDAVALLSGKLTEFTLINMRAEFLPFFEAKLVRLRGLANDNCLGYGEGTEGEPVIRRTHYDTYDNATGVVTFAMQTPSLAGKYIMCVRVGELAHYIPTSSSWDYTYDVADNGMHWWAGRQDVPSNQASIMLNLEFRSNPFSTTTGRVKLVELAAQCGAGVDVNTAPIAVDSKVTSLQRAQIRLHLPAVEGNVPWAYRVCVFIAPQPDAAEVWLEMSQLPVHMFHLVSGAVFVTTADGLPAFATRPSPAVSWGMSGGAPLLAGMLTVPFESQYTSSAPSLYVNVRDMPKNVSSVRLKILAEDGHGCDAGTSSDLGDYNVAKVSAVPSQLRLLLAVHLPTIPGYYKFCLRYGNDPWHLLSGDAQNSTVAEVLPNHLLMTVDAVESVVTLLDLATDASGKSISAWCGVGGNSPVFSTAAPPTGVPVWVPNATAVPLWL